MADADVMQAASDAAAAGDTETLEALIRQYPEIVHAHIPRDPVTLLHDVAVNSVVWNYPNALAVADLLIKAGADVNGPLEAAASVDAVEIAERLLDAGADPNGVQPWPPLEEALYWGQIRTARLLLGRGAAVKTLRAAAGLGDLEKIESFFEGGELKPGAGTVASCFGGDLPHHGSTERQHLLDNAFTMACLNGQVAAAKLLQAKGATIDALAPGYHFHGTGLHAAIWQGHTEIVKYLIEAGADLGKRDAGEAAATPLDWADFHSRDDIAALLKAAIGG